MSDAGTSAGATTAGATTETTPLEAARALRGLIESEAEAIDRATTMTKPVVDALSESGLFGLLAPRAFGGMESDVETIMDVCEELSFADGSVGWSYAQNTTVAAYSAYMAPGFGEPLARARASAGMFAPLGVANVEEGGYRVSGNYQFGSGCGHADYMGGAGLVMQDGQMAPSDGPLPRIIAFIVPTDRVTIKGNWDVMGLRGTGSYDFEIPEQFVDEGQTFSIFETQPTTGSSLYGLGPVPLGTISSVAWAIGVAKRALHEIAEIGKGGRTRLGSLALREQEGFQRSFGLHMQAVKAARHLACAAYVAAVDAVEQGAPEEVCSDLVRATKAAASYATLVSKAAGTFAWESSGSVGMRNPSVLQRCFRDLCVGSGHQVFDDRNYREVAKPILGLETALF